MNKSHIEVLGEHIPEKQNSLTLSAIKKFATVPYYIDWYKSSSSNKVFPILLQEISDLNATGKSIPFLISKNPFFEHAQIKFFISFKNGVPNGRIASFIDYNYNEAHGAKIGWLGLFESIEDKETAFQLFESAIKYLKENGCTEVLGPAKFNANGEVGLLVEGFDKKPYFMEPYNAPYYQDYFNDYGFVKENDWYSMNTDDTLSNGYMNKIDKMMQRINGTKRHESLNGFNIRNISFKDLDKEIAIIKDLYNPIWQKGRHPQFVQMTDTEFSVLALGIKQISLEELILLVEKDQKAVGVSVSFANINEAIEEYDKNKGFMPSNKVLGFRDLKRDLGIFSTFKNKLKNKKFKSMRVLILGVMEEYRKTGIDSKLYYITAKTAKSLGFRHASGSQLADINFDILNPLFKMGKIAMTWRVFNLKI